MLPLALLLATATPLELADVALSKKGCPLKLVDKSEHTFAEAQIACDAYVSFALIDEHRTNPSDVHARALAALLEDALGRGQASFRKLPSTHGISSSVLARGYLLTMMGGMATVDALPSEHVATFDAIASSLVDDLARHEWLPSYVGGYWPCDHALAASGLALHAHTRNNASSRDAGDALARRLHALLVQKGFPSQLNPTVPYARGTVLAWTAGFLALGGHDVEARAFVDALDDQFCEPFAGARACREFPKDVDAKADEVSGPIVMGYGSGASALAIAAYRANGDEDAARELEALIPLAPLMAGVPDVRASPKKFPLENAILSWGSHASPWLPPSSSSAR